MRKTAFTLLWLCSGIANCIYGQSIAGYEYWFDRNIEEKITVSSSISDELQLDIDVSSLSEGIHVYNFRAVDNEGQWSSPLTKYFFRTNLPTKTNTLTHYEYWIDGLYDERKQIDFTQNNISIDMDVSSLHEGIHYLSFRAQDNKGAWSAPLTKYFLCITPNQEPNELTRYEYWIDGLYNERKQTDFTQNNISIDMDVSSLYEGIHYLNFRAQDNKGAWSAPLTKYFMCITPNQEPNELIRYEYWIDNEYLSRRCIESSASEIIIDIDASSLYPGIHRFVFRSMDKKGNWSAPVTKFFNHTVPVETEIQIVGYEYWFNKNFEKRTFITTSPSTPYEMKNVSIDVKAVEEGQEADTSTGNDFYIHFKDSKGQWSEIITRHFTKGQGMDIADYEILKAFYNATGGAQWTTPWDISSPNIDEASWTGVNFNEGHVYEISLSDNNLTNNLPDVVFTLPALQKLDLSLNKLTGKLDTILSNTASELLCDTTLEEINLSGNNLTGEISAFASLFSNLKSLNLSGNLLTHIEKPLSSNITNLNIEGQFVDIQTQNIRKEAASYIFPLSQQINWPFNSLQLYNHSTYDFNAKPTIFLFNPKNKEEIAGGIYYNEESHSYSLDFFSDWMFLPEDTLWSIQIGDSGKGFASYVRFTYPKGDANIDQSIDILDVQHSLNYILDNGQVYPFNFCAADTYTDSVITVQDIVGVVNILLSQPQTEIASRQARSENNVSESTKAVLSIEENHIVLNSPTPVSALDITLYNINEKQLRALLPASQYQIMTHTVGEGVRLVIFSSTGSQLPTGRTELIELYQKEARLANACIADRQARYVPVALGEGTTGISGTTQDDWDVFTEDGDIGIRLSTQASKIETTLYDTQGRVLNKKNYNALDAGVHHLKVTSSKNGVYIARIYVTMNGHTTSRIIRFINSK